MYEPCKSSLSHRVYRLFFFNRKGRLSYHLCSMRLANNRKLKIDLTPWQLFDVSVKLVRSQQEDLVHVQQDAMTCVQIVIQK